MLMAATYREMDAQPWTSLPASLRRPGAPTAWASANFGRPVDCFLEGPDVDAQGNLWLVDIPFGRVLRVTPAGQWTVAATYDGWPNGLKCQDDGSALVADYQHGLVHVAADGAVSMALTHRHSERFRGVNDLTMGPDGTVYFTDQGQSGLQDPCGRVYRWQPHACAAPSVVMAGVPSPNGLVMNAAGTQLYVAVTRDNAIWRLPLTSEGATTKAGRWIALSGGIGPDGMAMDTDGGLWVAHIGLGCAWRFNARGEATLRVHTPGEWPTNLVQDPASGDMIIVESQRGELLRVPATCWRDAPPLTRQLTT